MEKVIYTISFVDEPGAPQVGDRLRGEVAARLLDLGAHALQFNVADDDVSAADGLRMTTSEAPADAFASIWVDSAADHLRSPYDAAIALAGGRQAAYLVTESVPIRNTQFPAAPGERTPGMAQVVCFRHPKDLPEADFLELWLGSHTQIAIDTQDTFSYVQNVVQRVLTPGAPAWHAIVEECFPAAAMFDPEVFFDAVGDPERLARHGQIMLESVQRFIDFDAIDVIPTSRYDN